MPLMALTNVIADSNERLHIVIHTFEKILLFWFIVDNYDNMIDQLNSENNAMFKIWASREKQICTVLKNIPILFESIKWIVGKELITSNILELSKKICRWNILIF